MNAGPATVSVIIPTCNRAGWVTDAIDSVLSGAPCRPPVDPEIIVVDDGSTDATAATVRALGPRVRYLHQQTAGPAAARNRGIRAAGGAFLAFLDDDDLWPADRLAKQLPVLLEDAATDIVLGHTQRMVRREAAPGAERFEAYGKPVRLHSLCCGLFRRGVFDRVGLLDERMRHAEDDDWFMRARALNVGMRFQPDVALFYRFHGSNMSTDKQGRQPDLLRLVKNRLDRIRGGKEDA